MHPLNSYVCHRNEDVEVGREVIRGAHLLHQYQPASLPLPEANREMLNYP